MANDPTSPTPPAAPAVEPVVLPETADFGEAPALAVPTIPPLVSKAIEHAVAHRGKVATLKLDTEAAAKQFENQVKKAATWSEVKIRTKIQADGLTVHFLNPDLKAKEPAVTPSA